VVRAIAGSLALVLVLTACAREASPTVSEAGPGGPRTELVVFAAASLTEALGELADVFEERTGVPVLLNLAGSQTLATQLLEGAPADVFVAADTAQMHVVATAGLVAESAVTVATNMLAIAVEPGNPLGVTGLADLARPELVVVLPSEAVPAGRYAREALARADVEVRPASLEQNVRAALARVAQGEADASVVYESDIVAADDTVEGIPIPVEQNVTAVYPMAVLAGAALPEIAASFAEFLISEDAQAVLRAHGFRGP
jgi:molybdate transport system substrate-binding protein